MAHPAQIQMTTAVYPWTHIRAPVLSDLRVVYARGGRLASLHRGTAWSATWHWGTIVMSMWMSALVLHALMVPRAWSLATDWSSMHEYPHRYLPIPLLACVRQVTQVEFAYIHLYRQLCM
jgi:hypothetical protein